MAAQDFIDVTLIVLPGRAVGQAPATLGLPHWLPQDHPFREVLFVDRDDLSSTAPLLPRCRSLTVPVGRLFVAIAEAVTSGHVMLFDETAVPIGGGIAALLEAHLHRKADLSCGLVGGVEHPSQLSPLLKRPEILRFDNRIPDCGYLIATAFLRTMAADADRVFGHGDLGLWPVWRYLSHHARWTSARTVVASHSSVDETLGQRPRPTIHARDIQAACGWRASGSNHEAGARILLVGRIDASVSHYFDGLPADLARQFRYLEPSRPEDDLIELASADAVVLVRTFQRQLEDGTLDLLNRIGVPCWYFADDHYPSLRQEAPDLWFYSPENLAAFFRRIEGVLASTPALVAEFSKDHSIVRHWPCVVDPTLMPSQLSTPPMRRIAIIGGAFRRQELVEAVLPALNRLAVDQPLELLHRADVSLATGLTTTAVPFDVSFRQFVRRWRDLAPSVVAHPRGVSANQRFKSAATILASLYLGAIPVVSAEAPFTDIDPEVSGLLVAADGVDGWHHALGRALSPDEREERFGRLSAWCSTHFSAAPVKAIVAEILDRSADRTPAAREDRIRRAIAAFPFRRDRSRKLRGWERQVRSLVQSIASLGPGPRRP